MKKSGRKGVRLFIFGLIVGFVLMFLLDMVFHFNNSIETQVKRELDKTINKVEEIFR
jgi:hypothetical protein